jgi:1,4-dihydroxy-2-naphthoate octaprenyltransferase
MVWVTSAVRHVLRVAPAFTLQLILGTSTPLPVIASLVPIMAGVALASAAELSFNWTGFLTAMMSNLTFGFRAVWSKR